jgi:hypothetical protein
VTVKRYSQFGFPFSNSRFSHTSDQRPGTSEFLVYTCPDFTTGGITRGIKHVSVLDDRRVKETIVSMSYDLPVGGHEIVSLLSFPKPTRVLEGVQIREITNEIAGGKTQSLIGENVVYFYDSILPPNSRR